MRLERLLFILALLSIVAERADAQAPKPLGQSKQLSADVKPLSPRARTAAPISLIWKLNWQGAELLEGHLELTVLDDREVLGRFRTRDLVLTTGTLSFRTMLPTIDVEFPASPLDIQTKFVTARREIDLGTRPLNIPGRRERSLVVAVCDPWSGSESAEQRRLLDSLRFEKLNPLDQKFDLGTFYTQLDPEEMPADAMGYCGFDVLVLSADGFSQLSDSQLDHILSWVDAGGSVCVDATGKFSPQHTDFLNVLVKSRFEQPSIVLDAAGRRFPRADGSQPSILTAPRGFGRAAILLDKPSTVLAASPQSWRRAVGFLWKIRGSHLSALEQTGKFSPPDVKQQSPANVDRVILAQFPDAQLFTVNTTASGSSLVRHLLPASVQVVPLSLIGFILCLYVLAIGPADYFLLGLLKQRRWTWVLFPAVTVAFTLFTVWLSHEYMAASGDKKSLAFLDVAEDGRIVRTSRFELLFLGSPQQVEQEIVNGLFTPFNHQRFDVGNTGFNALAGSSGVGPASYAGPIPGRYKISQQVPQWTPQLNRVFTIPADSAAATDLPGSKFDWADAGRLNPFAPPRESGASVAEQHEPPQTTLLQRITAAFGANAGVAIGQGGQLNWIANNSALRLPADFLSEACLAPSFGMFSVVSQISPTGGDNFEDLAVLDSTNSDQWLLVIAVPRGDDVLIFRKLYWTSH